MFWEETEPEMGRSARAKAACSKHVPTEVLKGATGPHFFSSTTPKARAGCEGYRIAKRMKSLLESRIFVSVGEAILLVEEQKIAAIL